METCCCGAPIASAWIDGGTTGQDETCDAVWRQRLCLNERAVHQNDVGSVACLEWLWWIGYPLRFRGHGTGALILETMAAKEAKNRVACRGKHLGCLYGQAGDCSADSVAIRSRIW